MLSPELKSISTNARFLYNSEVFPENETRILKDGDTFTVKFFNISGDPTGGHIPGGETTKWYHSEDMYRKSAKKYGFDIFIGDWKKYISNPTHEMKQDVLVIRKS